MRKIFLFSCLLSMGWLAAGVPTAQAQGVSRTLFMATSAYHNIRVVDQDGLRTLYFDDTMESRMTADNPITGQFEYTDYFHMVWLWNSQIKNVLMIGLGGATTARMYAHYYPDVKFETVEIDPMVAQVAKDYFKYVEGAKQKFNLDDGRQFLRRSTDKYDAIIFDAYTQGRYGASIPPHMVTKEFFQIVKDHLTPNGVVAYNLISTLRDYNTDIVGAMYHTMKEVFPQVYYFQAQTSLNMVVIATQSNAKTDIEALRKVGAALVESKKMTLPDFMVRLNNFVSVPPANYQASPILTDDYAPVEGLTRGGAPRASAPAPTKPPTPATKN